jgi:uncharacterized protein YjbJ (UPF0337 family)
MDNKKSDEYKYQNEKADGKQVQNRGDAQKHRGNLTEGGVAEEQGRMENLIAKLQEKYGISYEEAKEKAEGYTQEEIKEEEASNQEKK